MQPAIIFPKILLIGCLFLGAPLFAQLPRPADADQLNYFENNVRPVLVKYCIECHSASTEASGGLLLDSKVGWEKGGDSGAAIVRGRPMESRLIQAIRYDNPKLQMPPDKKLPADVVAVLEKWIADGSFDPRVDEKNAAEPHRGSTIRDAKAYWSYQPLQTTPALPSFQSPGIEPIDGFVNQKLAAAGITPGPMADRRDLVRRLYFDLTGLPPTLNEVQELDAAPDFEVAYRNLVDRLLSSVHYGESFARRWMDVARYAESVTLRGLLFKEAWRYRDYLVTAYAQDRPFDQMIREQIAGDLLQAEQRDERWMQLVATGFLAMGDTNFEKQDKQQLEMDYVDEQLDVVGQAFLGQTIGCARCHDHKFDPIPTKDYYALAGIFKSAVALRHSNVSSCIEHPLPLTADEEQRFSSLENELAQTKKSLAEKKKSAAALAKKLASKKVGKGADGTSDKGTGEKGTGEKGTGEKGTGDKPSLLPKDGADASVLETEVKLLEEKQKQLQSEVDLRPRYLTVVEEAAPRDLAIHVRGDVQNLGPIVPRGFLSVVQLKAPPSIPKESSGRLEFAQWVASADNPLTARVYVNRVWSWLMGQGLVDSLNNFGTTGSQPSHPELLDWLASELIRSDWSTKHMVRLIVLSDAYRRRAVKPAGDELQMDPENRLYWRGPQRRLSAEELRDAMLMSSGELDTTIGGTTIKPETKSDFGYRHDSTRRSLYQPVFRNALPELLDAFDFAAASSSIGARNRSTVATQAMALMNNAWVHARAKAIAARIESEHSAVEPSAWIKSAYHKCYQREPTAQELAICLEFFGPGDSAQNSMQLERLAHTLISSIDFRYLK